MNDGLLHGVAGEYLPLDEYLADFDRHFWRIAALGFWKLERQQVFQEPNEESWRAFARGDWDAALAAISAKRPAFEQYYGRIARQGFVNRRVRIVERPITPYLHWEFHVLLLRHAHGGLTRVVPAERVSPSEKAGPLPEVYTLGTRVMYEAVYDDEDILTGARRYTDPDLIVRTQRFIADLYDLGEPLDVFFAREIEPLSPPLPATGPQGPR
jgi:hypothetical protein